MTKRSGGERAILGIAVFLYAALLGAGMLSWLSIAAKECGDYPERHNQYSTDHKNCPALYFSLS